MKPKDPNKIKRIFKSTLDIVSDVGLAGLTMSNIGKKAEIGMGTIYTYFSSKEEIINALYLDLIESQKTQVYSSLDSKDPFMTNLKRLFVSYLEMLWNNEAEIHFIQQCKTSPFLTDDVKIMEEQFYGEANELMERGKKELIVKFLDNKILLSFMMGGVKELVRQFKSYDLPLDQKVINDMFELCASSIKK